MAAGANVRVEVGRNPVWLLPNLLSLDAPLVAVSWQILFARTLHVRVPASATIVLASCTWIIYVADRLMDAARGDRSSARHRFYGTHRAAVLPIFILVIAGTTAIAVLLLPRPMFLPGAVVCALVALHLGCIHFAPRRSGELWPKEAFVALVFASGVVAPVLGARPVYDAGALAAFALFGLLCWINCAAIEHPTRYFLSRSGAALANTAAICSLALAAVVPALGALFIACAVAAAAMSILLRSRNRISEEFFRVLADAVLLTPVLLFPFS